ncbi:hypothetical protein D3C72_2067700 [compost metagenome]
MLLAVDQEMRQRLRAGARGDDQEIRIVTVRDPRFLAVDDEVVAIPPGGSLDVRDVGADIRLADAHAPEHLPGQHSR